MKLDIRLPIGLLFLLVGGLLLAYGLLADPATTGAVASTRIDAWWGVLMMLFGAVMLVLARRRQRADARRVHA